MDGIVLRPTFCIVAYSLRENAYRYFPRSRRGVTVTRMGQQAVLDSALVPPPADRAKVAGTFGNLLRLAIAIEDDEVDQ